MVSANNEIWQWDTGYSPYGEGEINNQATWTFIAGNTIQKYDVVFLDDSGESWQYPKSDSIPFVGACGGTATDHKKALGIALNAADSGENVSVLCFGERIAILKTNKAINAGKWVRPSTGQNNEKRGCVYECGTGDVLTIGLALNSVSAPSTPGTGTVSDPYNFRPVAVLLNSFGSIDSLNT